MSSASDHAPAQGDPPVQSNSSAPARDPGMTSSPSSVAAPPIAGPLGETPSTRTAGRGREARGRRSVAVVATVAVAAVLIGFTVLGGWAAATHWTCRDEGQPALLRSAVPAILVNSPFRGVANGTGILAASFPGGPGYPTHGGDYGIGGPNGTANGAFFAVNLSIRNLANVSEWGPGQNAPCSLPLAVLPEPPPRGTSTGLTIPVPSNLTDQGEATTVNLSGLFIGSQNVPSWNNAFTWSNSPNVSTWPGG